MPTATVPDFSGVRLHVVTGKGGTGKTSVATALALTLASLGKRVLIVEVEGRQGLSQTLGVPPLSSEEQLVTRVSGGGEIWGLSVDPKAALVEYLDIFYHLGRAGRALEKLGAIDFATTIAPGVRDLLSIGKVYESVRRRGNTTLPDGSPDWTYDAVVLDAPPTGRVVQYLGVGEEVGDLAKVGPIRTQSAAMTELLTSPACAVHVVTLLEEMPVQEAADALEEIRAEGMRVGAIFVNQVRAEAFAADDLATVAAGELDRVALARDLAARSLDADDDTVAALVEEAREYAVRLELEDEQLGVIDSFGQPVVLLPFLDEGVDAVSVRQIAQVLTDQGVWR